LHFVGDPQRRSLINGGGQQRPELGAIDTEDREQFDALLGSLSIPRPRGKAVRGRGVAEQKSAEDQALVDGVEYVDTSAYEQYEKQEGDFIEGADVATPLDPSLEPGGAAEATVPPDEPSR